MSQELRNDRLFTLAELLFAPLIFHMVTVWKHDLDWKIKVGLIILFVLIQVEYLSIKQSSENYKIGLYLLDCFSFGMYFLAFDALDDKDPPTSLGYDPLFWACISGLWGGYAVWNLVFRRSTSDNELKAKLLQWQIRMTLFSAIGFTCFGAIEFALYRPSWGGSPTTLIVAQVVLVLLLIWTLYDWFSDTTKSFGKRNALTPRRRASRQNARR